MNERLKYKQSRYPVLFLTQGLTKKWQKFKDPRNESIEMAAYFALSIGSEGINAHAEDILNDRTLIQFVKSKNLVLFCWGDDLNKTELISGLKAEGVDGVVYDRFDSNIKKITLIINYFSTELIFFREKHFQFPHNLKHKI